MYIPANPVLPKLIGGSESIRIDPDHYGKFGSSQYWCLDYTFSDFGTFRVGSSKNKWKNRKGHTGHLYSPGTHYWEDCRSLKGEYRSCWILFTGADLNELVSAEEGYCNLIDPKEKLGNLIVKTAESFARNEPADFWSAQSSLCSILSVLHNSVPDSDGSRVISSNTASPFSGFARSVDEMLTNNVSGRISISEIAHELHLSESAVSHRYKKETGISPLRKFNMLKIKRVKMFMLRGYPLKWIAEEVGFSDEFHLSKMFKNIEGVPPSEYRKRI